MNHGPRRAGARVTFAALLLAAAAALAGETAPISATELSERMQAGSAPVILDIRTPEEFRAGHVPGAVNIPLQQLMARLDEIAGLRATEVVMHCETGRRAVYADEILRRHGFSGVRQLAGHMQGWRQGGYPVTPPGCVTC